MAYVTVLLLINASASALNNSGTEGSREENLATVKSIRKGVDRRQYPYFTAQAYRRWLRETIMDEPNGWIMSPVFYEDDKNLAYTDANPLKYWDDDLLGYMRAQSGGEENEKKRRQKKEHSEMTSVEVTDEKKLKYKTLTRLSPFRVSTFVSIAPVEIVNDFGVMSRQEGNPTLFRHQFYSATFQGLLSLDLAQSGTFTYSSRTGFQNLDKIRIEQAVQGGLEHLPEKLAYRLPRAERAARVRRLIEAIPLVQGGAKQTLHYTDTTPVVSIAAVTKYGSHPFNFLFDERGGQVSFNKEAFIKSVQSNADQFLSPVYIGWKPGYAEDQEAKLNDIDGAGDWLKRGTPLEAFRTLAQALDNNPGWLD